MKGLKLIILPVLICLLLSGCGGRSLSDYTIVQGIGIDSKNDKTVVSIQYLNLAKSTGGTDSLTENITTVSTGEAVNISDAVFSVSKVLSQEVFFGQSKLIVFGNDYVKDDISIGLDYLFRSVDSRPDVLVAMCDKKGEDIIRSTQNDARIPIDSVYELLETGEENGLGALVTVNDLLRLYSSQTSDIYLPVLKEKDDVVSCVGISVFSNERLAYRLDEDRSLAFLLMLDRVEDASMVVHDDDLGYIGVEIISEKSKRYVTVNDGNITFHCDIKAEIILDDIQKGITAKVDEKKIKSIENAVKTKIQNDSLLALIGCANTKSDPLEIGKYLAKADQKMYTALKDNWRDSLKDIDLDIKANVKLSKINESSTK